MFRLQSGTGLHSEWEDEINEDDLIRFLGYNIDLMKMHKIQFRTVIVTNKPPKAQEFTAPDISFTPKIIVLSDRDADAALTRIKRKIGKNEHINELELIYLPMYGSKSGKTMYDLLDTAIKLTPVIATDKHQKYKLQSLLILLMGKYANKEEFKKILEVNEMWMENNVAVEYLEERGVAKGASKIVELIKNGLTPEAALQEVLAESNRMMLKT